MGETPEKAKGRAKQTAGDVLGDDDLRAEGKRDELAGKAKEALDQLKEKAEEAVDEIKDRVESRREKR